MAFCGGLLGCSGGGDTISADIKMGIEKITYEDGEIVQLVVKIVIDGKVLELDLSDMLKDRTGQLVDFGSDMTPDELRQYFSVWYIDTAFPESNYGNWIRCYIYSQAGVRDGDEAWVYEGIRGAFDRIEDATINALVLMFEMSGMDVPDGPPPDDIC